MKKKEIIKSSREFSEIINKSLFVKSRYYSIYYRKKKELESRYGITVPKKTGNAVVRNKIKRQVKNIIDNDKNNIQNTFDYVIIIKRNILSLNYQEMETDLVNTFKKIGEL